MGGAVGGVIAGGCIGLTDGIATVACNAAAGGVGEFVTQAVGGGGLNAANIGVSALLGAGVGALPEPFRQVGFKPSRMYNVWNPGKNAMRQYGNAFFAGGATASMMGLVNFWQGPMDSPC